MAATTLLIVSGFFLGVIAITGMLLWLSLKQNIGPTRAGSGGG